MEDKAHKRCLTRNVHLAFGWNLIMANIRINDYGLATNNIKHSHANNLNIYSSIKTKVWVNNTNM